MKFFVALFALVAVAAANSAHKPIDSMAADIEAILAAIHHPSTDAATAALLQEQLQSIIGEFVPPISVGPAIIGGGYEPISVGPAIVEPPVHMPPSSSPLVQIIVNVKPGMTGNPVVVEGMPEVGPTPVIIVDKPVIVSPVVIPTPVDVVENPVVPEPVIVAPIFPVPAPVNIPEILN